MAKPTGEPSWRYRRLLTYAIIIWAAGMIWLLIDASDTRLNETIAWGLLGLILFAYGFYTGAATTQDVVAIMTTRSARPYAEDPKPIDPPADVTVVVPPPSDDLR